VFRANRKVQQLGLNARGPPLIPTVCLVVFYVTFESKEKKGEDEIYMLKPHTKCNVTKKWWNKQILYRALKKRRRCPTKATLGEQPFLLPLFLTNRILNLTIPPFFTNNSAPFLLFHMQLWWCQYKTTPNSCYGSIGVIKKKQKGKVKNERRKCYSL